MECTINWLAASGMGFVAETGSGHVLVMDGAPEGGGRNLAPRPMETVLAGTGGCAAYDVVLILKRGRHDVQWLPVEADLGARGQDPKVFTRFTCISRYRQGPARRRRPAGHPDVPREVLFRQHHAGQTAEITTSHEVVDGLSVGAPQMR